VTLIGRRVAALPGALITTLITTRGVADPSSVLTFAGYGVWYRFGDARRRWLVPVTAGLVMASAALLIRTTATRCGTAAVTPVAALGATGVLE
jgi:hypothetical protein